MTPREKKCVIFLSYLSMGLVYLFFKNKPIRYDFKPQPPEPDLTIKVPSKYTNSSYINSLDSTNSSSATSVETSQLDSKPKSP